MRNGLYPLSLLIAGAAILSALLAVLAAWSNLPKIAVVAGWVFVVAAGLWVGGTVYILSLSGKHLWNRFRRTNNDQPAS